MREPWEDAFVALGSNLGDRHAMLELGVAEIARSPKTRILRRSSIIETSPMGPPGQGPYLNAVVRLQTRLSPRGLLDRLLEIESAAGRDRAQSQRWGPRTLDLDLILYSREVISEPGLVVPHPGLQERTFVLEPLCELAPDLLHPVLRRTMRDLLNDLRQREPTA